MILEGRASGSAGLSSSGGLLSRNRATHISCQPNNISCNQFAGEVAQDNFYIAISNVNKFWDWVSIHTINICVSFMVLTLWLNGIRRSIESQWSVWRLNKSNFYWQSTDSACQLFKFWSEPKIWNYLFWVFQSQVCLSRSHTIILIPQTPKGALLSCRLPTSRHFIAPCVSKTS